MNPSKKDVREIPIEIDQVMKRVGQDKDFLHELINIYIEEFSEKIKILEKSIAEKDYSVIQETGHYLKGSSANLSLTYLEKESYNMEYAGKKKNIHKARKSFKNLNKEFELFNKYFREMMSV